MIRAAARLADARMGQFAGAHASRRNGPLPAFLVGFPRSGTTLLDTILMGHPAIEVLEEEPTLMHATEALARIRRHRHGVRRSRSAKRATPISKLRGR